MKQIEISDNTPRKGGILYQTFYIDNSAHFPYWKPLYLVVSDNEKQAAKSAKNQYFYDNIGVIKSENWKQKIKDIRVMAKIANPQKDKEIHNEINNFNNAKNITNRVVCEISHRMAEEKINTSILNY